MQVRNRRLQGGLHLLLVIVTAAGCTVKEPGNVTSSEAVREVLNGKRSVANAAWWGFDETDATETLQAAINSGAAKVIIPDMGREWIVRPINLAGTQELVFEKGAVVTAKTDEFKGRGESLLTGSGIANLTISGYGAVLRMHKHDYQDTTRYAPAEWRHTLCLLSCTNVKVSGLTLP